MSLVRVDLCDLQDLLSVQCTFDLGSIFFDDGLLIGYSSCKVVHIPNNDQPPSIACRISSRSRMNLAKLVAGVEGG